MLSVHIACIGEYLYSIVKKLCNASYMTIIRLKMCILHRGASKRGLRNLSLENPAASPKKLAAAVVFLGTSKRTIGHEWGCISRCMTSEMGDRHGFTRST